VAVNSDLKVGCRSYAQIVSQRLWKTGGIMEKKTAQDNNEKDGKSILDSMSHFQFHNTCLMCGEWIRDDSDFCSEKCKIRFKGKDEDDDDINERRKTSL